jgi:hypothetical protein
MFFDTHVHFDDFVKDGSLESVPEHAGVPNPRKKLTVQAR